MAAVLAALVVAGSYVAALVGTGSAPIGVAAWLTSICLGLVMPGFVVVRALRPVAGALVEDLSWGAAAGLVLALVGWSVDRVAPWPPGSLVFGLAVTVALLAVPFTRARVLARPAAGWGVRATIGLAACHLVALAWMLSTALRGLPPRPGPSGFSYIHDMTFQLALTGELQHHLLPDYPMVAGEPLSYHWFVYAIQAHLIACPGVDRIDVVLRLMPSLLVPMLVSLGAVVARQLADRTAAGVLGAALLAVVGNSLATRWVVPNGIPTRWNADGGSLEALTVYWQDSPPQALGWVAGVACLGLAVAFVRRGVPDRVAPTRLLVPFLVLAAGAKSSQLPVLATGLGLALLVAVLVRRWRQAGRTMLLLVGTAAVLGIAAVTIYAGGSYGLILRPWARLVAVVQQETVDVAVRNFPGNGAGAVGAPPLVMTAFGVVYLLPTLPRLAGLLLLTRAPRSEPALWIPLGSLVGGLGATLMLRHPSASEVFFLVSAYPVAVVGSAAGFVLGLEGAWGRLSAWSRPGALVVAAGGVAAGLLVACVVAYRQPAVSPRTAWVAEAARAVRERRPFGVSSGEQTWTWLRPHVELWSSVAAVVVALALVTAALNLVPRHDRRRPPWSLVAVALVGAMLGTGCFGTWLHVHRGDGLTESEASQRATAAARRAGLMVTTPELVRAADLIRRSSAEQDVVATNRYCLTAARSRAAPSGCAALDFTVSAFTARQVDVSGWGYAPRALQAAWTSPTRFTNTPFWDPGRLDAELAAFSAPTADGLVGLWRQHGVRWLLADRSAGAVDESALDLLADRQFNGREIVVWRLRAPGPRAVR
ncbi:hypothetical protein [Pedococcus sp. 5OH_020]|uniref:hypothetical protein n=1 Tax=Pedococcus sp. 5OH_020 TaxID=2989814 RepID=UPI0022EA0D4A|nr:hypothetical protein [Pedococcus sp. 5OH_020]